MMAREREGSMTPNLALVHWQNPSGQSFVIPLPLFLLWIPILLLSPLILIVVAMTWAACVVVGYKFWAAMAVGWAILCALPGTQVRVSGERTRVAVRIF